MNFQDTEASLTQDQINQATAAQNASFQGGNNNAYSNTAPPAPTMAGVAPPAPFIPSPFTTTPAQNASTYTPPAGNTAIIPAAAGATNPNFLGQSAGKGSGKGSLGQQAIVPAQGPLPDTSANPMDFHTQLQNFIQSGLLGGQQRVQ